MIKTIAVIVSLFAAFVFIPVIASAAAPNMQDGQWEITTTMEMKGMPANMSRPFTYTHCMTRNDAVPQKREKNKDCTIKNQKVVGNTVSWEMVCKEKDGSVMESTGKITYRGDKFNGTMKAKMTGKERGNMVINYKMSGRRLGPCTEK
jgi:hypothetical protein